MTSAFRVARPLLLGAGLAALAFAAPALSQSVTDAPVWPQVKSDIKGDPAARFGQLSNGMRYVILHNTTPPHETSVRLRIGSGSLEEEEDQLGLAHFLEHMAFKGSTHVPEGEMVKLLQRHGLAFGADTNASTGFTQTVYQLDLPQSDDESLDLGLMLMRETGSELNLDPKAMEPERGVVLSEERVRDTPAFDAAKKRQAFQMKGLLAPDRWPIGSVKVLQTAPASRLRAFYQANYRPERATLVVVGDVDVDKVEAKIKAKFGDWKGVGPATAEPAYGVVAPRGAEAQVIVQPGTTMGISVSWTKPHDPAPDSFAKEKRSLIRALGLLIVSRRMERLAQGDNPPYLAASVGYADTLRSIAYASLAVTPKGDDWQGALRAADAVRRQVLQYGVQTGELDRSVSETRTRLRGAIGGVATRRSPALAQQIVNDVDSDQVFADPRQNLAVFEGAVRDLKPEDVDAALREAFSGNGPLISMVTPTPLAGGEAALLAAFKAAETQPIQPAEVIATKPWPYSDFGKPGVVVEKHEVPDLGVTFVRFQNGVRLAFKQTNYSKDQVSIAVDMPGGLVSLPRTRPTPIWASAALAAGGTGKITPEDADQALSGKQHNIGVRVSDTDFGLNGTTRRVDLDAEMQFLTAYVSDPAWRPSAFDRLKSLASLALDQQSATPQGVLGRQLAILLHSGDPRWAEPTKTEVAATTVGDVRAVWDRPLAQGPIEVDMVGDVSLDRAIDAVAKTFGALPPRQSAPAIPAGGRDVRFPPPTATPVRLTHTGRPDQAIADIAWPSTDFFADPREARALSLAVQVFEGRLIDRVRIAEGATYSPSASSRPSDDFPGYGVVSAAVETPPSRIEGFFQAVSAITADLRDHPISADELERAKKPRLEQIEKSQATNPYWMARLTHAEDDPRRLNIVRETLPSYQSITAADIQAVARKYLRDDTAFKLVVVPEASAKP
jgi:zinc protease